MLLELVVIVVGFAALAWSADQFVEAAAALARNIGVSELFIGLTVVSIGTSAPEILVAIADSFTQTPDIAIGNAIGSNIANMGLVLGLTALVVPLPFAPSILKSEIPMLLGATTLGAILLFDLHVGRFDGLVMLGVFGLILFRMFRQSQKSEVIADELNFTLQGIPQLNTKRSVLQSILGLVILLISASAIVWAAEKLALLLGVDEIIIGLTVVALGTSLPELAVTLRSAIKGGHAIAIGNIVGSNLLNLLVVLSVPALLHPSPIAPVEYWRDFGLMFFLTVLIAVFAYLSGSKKSITRLEGGFLLAIYIGYILLLYVSFRLDYGF